MWEKLSRVSSPAPSSSRPVGVATHFLLAPPLAQPQSILQAYSQGLSCLFEGYITREGEEQSATHFLKGRKGTEPVAGVMNGLSQTGKLQAQ